MCGIVGGVAATSNGAFAMRRMADMIRHRGPDGDGVWTDAEAGVALSQRRLAIIDLSSAGAQPMISHSGRYVIVFNGEIYNHVEMRALLDREFGAHAWRGHSDTEVFLAAIEEVGLRKALESAVGMFAFGLWDRRERTLVLGRDRLGEKPLYYGRIANAFVFASEPKAFHPLPDWRPEIDRDALALLMRHNYIPAPYSIYRDIRKLSRRPDEVATQTVALPACPASACRTSKDGLRSAHRRLAARCASGLGRGVARRAPVAGRWLLSARRDPARLVRAPFRAPQQSVPSLGRADVPILAGSTARSHDGCRCLNTPEVDDFSSDSPPFQRTATVSHYRTLRPVAIYRLGEKGPGTVRGDRSNDLLAT